MCDIPSQHRCRRTPRPDGRPRVCIYATIPAQRETESECVHIHRYIQTQIHVYTRPSLHRKRERERVYVHRDTYLHRYMQCGWGEGQTHTMAPDVYGRHGCMCAHTYIPAQIPTQIHGVEGGRDRHTHTTRPGVYGRHGRTQRSLPRSTTLNQVHKHTHSVANGRAGCLCVCVCVCVYRCVCVSV